jgi:hypothetical protein
VSNRILFPLLCGLSAFLLTCAPARAGQVRVELGPKLTVSPALDAALRDRAFETLAENISAIFDLPQDLILRVADCGDANSFYEAENASILVCGELLPEFAAMAADMEPDPDLALGLVYDNLLFTVYHELGHVLVDILQLPITGREEDVADQVAVWLLLETLDEGEGLQAALDAADFFYAPPQDGDNLDFWDSHGLDIQRYHNIVCWAYGYDPQQAAAAFGDHLDEALPPERRQFCADEYAQMDKSFRTLLDKVLRK